MYVIYPNVKVQVGKDYDLSLAKALVFFSKKMQNVANELQTFLAFEEVEEAKANILFLNKKSLNEEAYELDVNENNITIYASSNSGFFYAVKTLKQMINGEINLKGVHIEDEPDLKIRGFMYDISRNKVAKLSTLEYIADIMSDLKMNHFELYVEGFSFEYKSFPEYLTKNAYITVSEYKKLEKYCKDRCIDLVPNQNGFGHMEEWLKTPEYKDLAVAPDGIFLWGTHRRPTTLDPCDPRSAELVSKMYDDMLPISKSKYFNMNFDEPFELGHGKSKELVEKTSEEEVYIDFVNKVYPFIKKYNKQPMIWGDVLCRHDADLSKMPKDIIYLDWGYEGDYPFDSHLQKLKDANVPFMAAPGTTTWCGWLGRLYDWTENISNAIWNTYRLGGLGVLTTEWGDFGHLQNLGPALPPLALTGLLSYRCKAGVLKQVRQFLNKFVFKDKNNLFADVIMDASSYYQFEKQWRGNGTVAHATFVYMTYAMKEENKVERYNELMRWSRLDKENYIALTDFIKTKKKQIALCDVDDLWKKEYNHTLDLIQALSDINIGLCDEFTKEEKIKYLEKGKQGLIKSKKTLKKVWLARNKYSLLDKTFGQYDQALEFIDILIESL